MEANEKRLRLKVNLTDNTITIKKIKDSYSREEVDRLLDEQASKTTAEMLEKFKGYKSREGVEKLLIECCGEISCEDGKLLGKSPEELYKWIEENL